MSNQEMSDRALRINKDDKIWLISLYSTHAAGVVSYYVCDMKCTSKNMKENHSIQENLARQ